ncbi:MAG: VOC family protein [Thermoplasmata archaeon]|nr:VOC family protein [Thermoplasmata archaeon]
MGSRTIDGARRPSTDLRQATARGTTPWPSRRGIGLEVPLTLAYFGIRVRDLDRSIKFYCEGLGLRERGRGTMSHGGVFVGLEDPTSHQQLELNWYPPGSLHATDYDPGDGLDHLGFEVTDADVTYQRLLTLGATPALPVWLEDGRYRIGFVQDPDGIWVEIQSLVVPLLTG